MNPLVEAMALALTASPSISLVAFYGIPTFVLALLYLLARRHRPKFALPCPPGPKSPNMPSLDPWVTYQEWGRVYGDLVYIQEMNMLIISSSQAAVDLLEKRARIYSDRETSSAIMVSQVDRIMSVQRYSNKWRRHRKFFHQSFRQSACSRFYPAQYRKINDLLRNLAVTPEQFMQHTMAFSQSLMYATLYGLDIGSEDPLLRKAESVINTFGDLMFPGFPSLERFPWLRYMPSSFPGCGFQRVVKKFIQNLDDLDAIPFDRAVENLKNGAGTSLIAELALEKPMEVDMIKAMGTTSFVAASDTTTSSISSFLLTVTLHPEVQVKAQAEIDRVIGRDRLPTFEDRKSLLYIEGIYREIMRLHPPGPLAINHVSTEDDFYNGYHIPKGCVVVPNIWAMNRDPNVYPDPDKFMPERYLDSPDGPFTNINDVYAFGFGRRVCVGRYMAENTVWLTIASIMATFDLCKAKDDGGDEIDIPEEYTQTFFRHPKPYQSCIKPRDQQALELILRATE
ncbi:cytochrome P450 1 [Rhodocollybia butyracea]|uniref:Cytochrome P450 1 n=1 Tax=Rhodocollybia butyracea TaxID=206335 RepID=A0A9P5UA58_9AGAR|nr:cytochrome P450 1 [Rhodocollybia butyracea]